ncbi:MAG: maleylpyruvate isomerase family mycothiol-dependent enzyme [Ilumatobacteraceae bacterium]
METWDRLKADREAFADYLATLTEQDWAAPSWCAGWSVKDVTTHLLVSSTMSNGQVFRAFLASGFNLDKMSAKLTTRMSGEMSNEQVVAATRSTAGVRSAPPGLKPVGVFAELVTHANDISMAIGKPFQLPMESAVIALDHMKGVQPVLGCRKRIAGLRLQATDTEWSTGSGPLVEGDVQHLLSAMTGRKQALADLSGDGVNVLRGR